MALSTNWKTLRSFFGGWGYSHLSPHKHTDTLEECKQISFGLYYCYNTVLYFVLKVCF